MKTMTEVAPYLIHGEYRLRVDGGPKILARNVTPELERYVKRGTMFPMMLAAMVYAEQALYRCGQCEALPPDTYTDAHQAHTMLRSAMEVLRGRHLHDPEEQAAAEEMLQSTQPFAELLAAAEAVLPLADAAEGAAWLDGEAETDPNAEALREILRGYGVDC